MSALIAAGYTFIKAVQEFRHPLLDEVFLLFTFVGGERFLLVLVPVLLWAYSRRLGLYVALLFILSGLLNTALKATFRQPRPSPELVARLTPAEGYGLPSGHAQNAVVTWGWIARAAGGRLWPLWAVVLSALIGFSRIYLGVHFPHDVVAGWGIGTLILYAVIRWGPAVEQWLVSLPARAHIGLALLPLTLLPSTEDTLVVRAVGALVGASLGAVVEHSTVRFAPGGPWRQRVLCLAVGFVGLALIWGGGKLILPSTPAGYLLRYGLTGAWVTLGAPWTFVRAGLARPSR
ncbi:MAG: phosphatase PAP2 family protein [Ardenticatenia bacterium]|nr:phosphatase PAP2 family protein [Ardenticatenia bacterium]